jgi:hypothetical protein
MSLFHNRPPRVWKFCQQMKLALGMQWKTQRFSCASMGQRGAVRKPVCRRSPCSRHGQEVPIGVRGAQRNQRWAAFCHPKLVKSILTPPPTTQSHDFHVASRCHPCFPRLELSRRPRMGLALPWGREAALASSLRVAAMRQSSRAIWISSFMRKGPSRQMRQLPSEIAR